MEERMKIFWLDTETTGVSAGLHAMIQLACLIEINGEVQSTFLTNVRPHPGARIDKKALEVNKLRESDLISYPEPLDIHRQITDLMKRYVDKYDPNDKFVLAGYNVAFDDGFLRSFFRICGDIYYGSYFAWPKIDVAGLVAEEYLKGLRVENFKLETICARYGIPIKAHNALEDITATRSLYYRLKNGLPEEATNDSEQLPS